MSKFKVGDTVRILHSGYVDAPGCMDGDISTVVGFDGIGYRVLTSGKGHQDYPGTWYFSECQLAPVPTPAPAKKWLIRLGSEDRWFPADDRAHCTPYGLRENAKQFSSYEEACKTLYCFSAKDWHVVEAFEPKEGMGGTVGIPTVTAGEIGSGGSAVPAQLKTICGYEVPLPTTLPELLAGHDKDAGQEALKDWMEGGPAQSKPQMVEIEVDSLKHLQRLVAEAVDTESPVQMAATLGRLHMWLGQRIKDAG